MSETKVDSKAGVTNEPLALLGGSKAVEFEDRELFHWPIVTQEDEEAVLEVLRAGTMSQLDVTRRFEAEFTEFQGVKHALGYCNGTMALYGAMYAAGVGRGDEIICPSLTYWASGLPAFSMGASVVFADVEPDSLCIDAKSIEEHVTPRTKAIVVVHYCGHPADMYAIQAVAAKHDLKIIEDVSHAHGALYKGRMVGTFGDVAAMSMMSGKALAIGEAGMLVTDDREIFERAISFTHYSRHDDDLNIPELVNLAGMPLGGVKGRLNQTCAAMGRVQLRYYPERMDEIQRAMNRFWDLLEGTPGVRAHRTAKDSGSTMGGWYNPVGRYLPEELGGLHVDRFIEAVSAEGARIGHGANEPMHLHPVFNDVDIYSDGRPTRIAFTPNDLRQPRGSLPVTESVRARGFSVPWFKHDRPEAIESYAAAFRKVALQAEELL
jgi:dTDP-4-amino-4,6-dideoxygalactose transaminase